RGRRQLDAVRLRNCQSHPSPSETPYRQTGDRRHQSRRAELDGAPSVPGPQSRHLRTGAGPVDSLATTSTGTTVLTGVQAGCSSSSAGALAAGRPPADSFLRRRRRSVSSAIRSVSTWTVVSEGDVMALVAVPSNPAMDKSPGT